MRLKYFLVFLTLWGGAFSTQATEVLKPLDLNIFPTKRSFKESPRTPVKRSASEISEDSEDKENYFQTPPSSPKSKKSRSDKLEISPHCQSKVKEGCLDPRVLKESLNYSYEGVVNDQCDAWHDRNLKILEEILQKNENKIKDKNIAVAGIHFVYEHNGEILFSPTVDLDILFLSGGTRAGKEFDLNLKTASKRHLEPKTIFDLLAGDYEGPGITKKMRGHLKQYFDDSAGPTKMNTKVLSTRYRQCLSPEKKVTDKKNDPNGPFMQSYFHSEQASQLLLTRSPEVLAPSVKTVPKGATILQVTVLMASRNQMCRNCAAAWYRISEGAGPLKNILLKYLQEFPNKDFDFKENKLDIFPQVSGLTVFDCVKADHCRAQMSYAKVRLKLPDFLPHVAQKSLPNQLKKGKKKNEPKKNKKFTFKKLSWGPDDD